MKGDNHGSSHSRERIECNWYNSEMSFTPNSSLLDILMLMKLYTVVVYYLRM